MFCNRIIAICGNKGSGKDTLANDIINRRISSMSHNVYTLEGSISFPELISDIHKGSVKRFAFADKLKREFTDETNICINSKSDYVRLMLHEFSSNIKETDCDYYTREIKNVVNDANTIIISDLRLHEELNYLKTLSCELITIRVLHLDVDCVPSNYERCLDNLKTDFITFRKNE
jgi:tRNA uridine 5-carbamoylmethylation protein Kti12